MGRQNAKNWRRNVYDSWDDIDFGDGFRLTRKNFDFISNRIKPYIEKTTNILHTLIESDRQLTFFRL